MIPSVCLRLQLFEQHVCMNAARLNDFLRSGEMLIQRCETTDAQHVEQELLELLRRRSHIFNNITRTHTRLLSMRLVRTHARIRIDVGVGLL